MRQALVIGCGLSGAVIARELADSDWKVRIIERRNHIGGNMYDYVDEYGILVHKYGPHTFHTKNKMLYDYMCRYAAWDEYHLECGAEIEGVCTPTPFNYQTIDDFFESEQASEIKREIENQFQEKAFATVVECLICGNPVVEQYARFLFEKDYSLYSAKQWGCKPSEIDPSILKRVPLRFNYERGYFDDKYQAMPHTSYKDFFECLLDNQNIQIELEHDALKNLHIKNGTLYYDEIPINYPVIYTGPLDELFKCVYGSLPYRSLRFVWKHEDIESKQDMPVVAYPQAEGYTRIVEYKKLPYQNVRGTTYGVEYPLTYIRGGTEPCYPLLTGKSQEQYENYKKLAKSVKGLFICGRLADFKYYNMDQALEKALDTAASILKCYSKVDAKVVL